MAEVLSHVAAAASLCGILPDRGTSFKWPADSPTHWTLWASLCCNTAPLWSRRVDVTCWPQCCIVCLHLVPRYCECLYEFQGLLTSKEESLKKKKKEDGLVDDVFLRICSKVRCQPLDLGSSLHYIQLLRLACRPIRKELIGHWALVSDYLPNSDSCWTRDELKAQNESAHH